MKRDWLIYAFVIVMAACIPLGMGLVLYTDNTWWLLLSVAALLVASAG